MRGTPRTEFASTRGSVHDGRVSKAQVVQLIDDITGEAGDDVETVTFAVDGVEYEIELTAGHRDELVAALRPYVEKGRRVGRPARRRK